MSITKNYIQKLFEANNLKVHPKRESLFEAFFLENENQELVKIIIDNQKQIMNKWELLNKINDIKEANIFIPNAKIGVAYVALIDFSQNGFHEIIASHFDGLEDKGLVFDQKSETITGIPTIAGEFKITFCFKVSGESEDTPLHQKQLNLIINLDPKSLWKNNPSDAKDKFWKPDNAIDFEPLGDKSIVIASKRGRSHANVGSFREDDFTYKHFDNTNWSVVAVSDGAGSASLARKGSEISCKTVVEYFQNNLTEIQSLEFDKLYQEINWLENESIAESKAKMGTWVYNLIGGCANAVHQCLVQFAEANQTELKNLHNTLIFSLFKKIDSKYVILSFSVGDCPIGVLNKEKSEIKLLNTLDVGDYGGGTRFVTMPEIFSENNFSTRITYNVVDDFSYLFLMTDGIYDAKFMVEANLEKTEKWLEFLNDLNGNNSENAKVVFDKDNTKIAMQLSTWMDFWSPGNHDDRTLAVIF